MSKEIESVSEALFDKIRTRFSPVTLGDSKAKATDDPSTARFFNFIYCSNPVDDVEDGYAPEATEFGRVTISLIDEESLKIYFAQNIMEDMSEHQRKEWYEFLRNLRQFARRNLLSFDTRDINKSNLDIRDIKQQAKTDDTIGASEISVTESKMYGRPGRPYNSFAKVGSITVAVKHKDKVDEAIRGSRSRHVESIFLENDIGERFKLEHTNLHGAFALAEHLNNGGALHDDFAGHINGMVSEMAAMRHFVRTQKLREFEDAETADMTHAAVERFKSLQKTLRHLRSPRYYDDYKTNFEDSTPEEEEIDIEELKERFVKKIYDQRFDDALPYVYRAYKNHKATRAETELDEWANALLEELDDLENDDQPDTWEKFFSKSRPGGINGIDAQNEIKQIMSNADDLLNKIENFAGVQGQGPDADTRGIIWSWLSQHDPDQLEGIEMGQGHDQNLAKFQAQTSPTTSHPDDNTYGATTMDEPVYEMRRLAGLK
jgi:hypothetical protein